MEFIAVLDHYIKKASDNKEIVVSVLSRYRKRVIVEERAND